MTDVDAAEPTGSPAVPEDGVFVSYRHQEPVMAWTRTRLAPRLAACGLRVCIDHVDFRPGVPVTVEMARAVETNRYTVAVLTPAYMESGFTELEAVMARVAAPPGGRHDGRRRAPRRAGEGARPRRSEARRPFEAVIHGQLADALCRRDRPGDREAALTHYTAAAELGAGTGRLPGAAGVTTALAGRAVCGWILVELDGQVQGVC
jgi:hypothetical protein